MATPSGPGLLYVNSGITDPAFSEDNFHKWYNEVHIPDMFASSKDVKSATRYKSVGKTERPFLALYPVNDVQYLGSKAFSSVPMKHNLLPGDGNVFEYGDFDIQFFTHLTTKSSDGFKGTSNYVVAVLFDAGEEPDELVGQLNSRTLPIQEQEVRTSLWKQFGPGDDAEAAVASATYKLLLLLEFEEQVDTRAITSVLAAATSAEYSLLQEFGETVTYFA